MKRHAKTKGYQKYFIELIDNQLKTNRFVLSGTNRLAVCIASIKEYSSKIE